MINYFRSHYSFFAVANNMLMKVEWKGVYPALTTQFTIDEELDIAGFLKNVDAQITAGVDGLIIGGSLGESSTLSQQEKIELLNATLESQLDKPVLVNIAEGSTRNAVQLAQLAERNGAHGLMILPPMMYKSTDAETVAHFKTVAMNTSLPIMIYNNPVDYKIEVTMDMFEELLKQNNIQAVKESTRDISNITRIRNRFGDDLKIMCGVDTLAFESLVSGADGWVAGLVDAFPAETVAIYRLVKAGRLDEARAINRWFMPILELDINPQLVQNIKLAETFTGIGSENVRSPRRPLEGMERDRVIKILERGMASRPTLPNYLSL